MTKYRALFGLIAVLLTLSVPGLAAEQPRPATADQAQVVEVIRSMFAALAAEDIPKLGAIIAPDFYLRSWRANYRRCLDRFNEKAHAAGKVYVWTVNEPEAHIDGDMAWVTYLNRGSIKDSSETKNVSWLESAVLRKEEDDWRIRFLHSTRLP